MRRKIILPVFILLAIFGGVVYYRAVTRPSPIILTGIVTTNDVIASSQIQGQLAQVLVAEGDTVKPGQLLAVIQPGELRADASFYTHSQQGTAAQVSEAKSALLFQQEQTRDQIRQAEAALAAAQAAQKEAEANLELNRVDLERTESLFRQKIDSQQALDQARATFQAQLAHVESLRKQVDSQRAAVALAQSNQAQTAVRQSQLESMQRQLDAAGAQRSKAQVRLDYTEIHAPIAGVVAVLAARQGEVVNVGQPIVSIINPDDLWVRADVPETYIDRIRLGDHMQIRFPDGMEREGAVFYRAADADYATQRDVSSSKRDIKTFEFRLRVDNKDRRLWPGLTAFVTLPPQDVR